MSKSYMVIEMCDLYVLVTVGHANVLDLLAPANDEMSFQCSYIKIPSFLPLIC